MTEQTRNFWVGVTSLGGLVGLAFMLLLFGYVPDWWQGGYPVRVALPSAAGLHEGGIVTYRGLEVGKVLTVELRPADETGVVATLLIHDNVKLPSNVSAVLEASVFGTTAQLALGADSWPHGDGPITFLATDGSAQITGSSSSAVDSFAELSAQVGRLADEWVKVGSNLNALLEPRDPAAVDSGDTLANASTVLARLDKRLAEMETTLAGVNRYLHDDALWNDVHATVASARELSGSLNAQLPADVTAVRNSVIALADDLSKTVAMLNETIEAARKPDGTLGKLLVDPALYDNMNDTFVRLQKAIDDLSLLAEKWKEEGLPVKF